MDKFVNQHKMLNWYDGAHLGYSIKGSAVLWPSGEFLHPREDAEHGRDEAPLSNQHTVLYLLSDVWKDFR